MKHLKILLISSLFFISTSLFAQVENVIVEKYYVSDANDATDTTGGQLDIGSVTYRIYIDLNPGTKIRKIYGDANHALKFSSTACFFNNKADGESFGKDFSKSRLQENTVALDTWITLGQASRTSSNTNFGILKSQDNNGSFIGGVNNDGGSAGIAGGLLINNDSSAGMPLTTSDGLATMTIVPTSWADYGIADVISGNDSTIFGSIVPGMQFISYNAGLQNSGVAGVNPDSNLVLIAQLTTKGEITFEINVEVEEINGSGTQIVKYVANGDSLSGNEKLCPFLKYPPVCGCRDPNYLEYNASYSCNNRDSCRTLIVFGCTDTMACNFDPDANFNIPSMCCYPGYCNDRDISVVCPQLNYNKLPSGEFELFPNPAEDQLSVKGFTNGSHDIKYLIYDSYGRLIIEKSIIEASSLINQQFDISEFKNGIYLLRIYFGEEPVSKMFIKD